jgi:hypothetical protein
MTNEETLILNFMRERLETAFARREIARKAVKRSEYEQKISTGWINRWRRWWREELWKLTTAVSTNSAIPAVSKSAHSFPFPPAHCGGFLSRYNISPAFGTSKTPSPSRLAKFSTRMKLGSR